MAELLKNDCTTARTCGVAYQLPLPKSALFELDAPFEFDYMRALSGLSPCWERAMLRIQTARIERPI
jgi:hypothetical protein